MSDSFQRYTRNDPCPICGRHANDPAGDCHGILTDRGAWARCTRADGSDGAMLDEKCSPPASVYRRQGDGSYRPWTVEPPMQATRTTNPRMEARRAPTGQPHVSKAVARATRPRPEGTRYFPYGPDQRVKRFDFAREDGTPDKRIRPEHRNAAGLWIGTNGPEPIERVYRRDDLTARPDAPVYIVEGEGCADALHDADVLAITWRGGCGQVRQAVPHMIEAVRGRDVTLAPDADSKGRAAMLDIAMTLRGVAKSVRIVNLYADESGRDIEDWLHEGGTVDRLTALIDAMPAYEPDTTADDGSMTLRELMQREFVPRREFVPGIITEGISLLASKAKIGKTWLVLGTSLALATGGVALGKIHVEKTGVLLLALEDGPQRLQDRFSLLLDDKPAPDGLTIFTEWPRLDAGGAEQLDAFLSAHPDVKTVFVDTLAKIRPARRKGGDLYTEDYHIGEILKVTAEKHRVAIVIVYHTRKASADDPLDEIRDTVGLTGGVDNCLVLRRERGSADAVLYVSGRDIAEEKGYALKWDAVTTQWTVAGDASEYAASTARKQVLDALDGAPNGLTPTETARKLGKPLSAVKKLMWTMSNDGTLAVTDGRYQKRGNPGNRVTHREKTLATQANPKDPTVTLGLPNVALSNPKSNRADGDEANNNKENAVNGYPVTGVTDAARDAIPDWFAAFKDEAAGNE